MTHTAAYLDQCKGLLSSFFDYTVTTAISRIGSQSTVCQHRLSKQFERGNPAYIAGAWNLPVLSS